MSSFTLNRRTLDRFRRDHKDNTLCWDRRPDKDSFFSVIDTHNHFRPFGGPAVEFNTYLQWMQDAGIIFSTMFGIGQLIKKAHEDGNDFYLCFSIRFHLNLIILMRIRCNVNIFISIFRSRLLLLLALSDPRS